MKSIESKLVLLLADNQLTDADFEQLARLDTPGLRRCISAAAHLRKQARPALTYIKRLEREVTDSFEPPALDPEFFRAMSRLLLKTKLGPAETIRRLSKELGIDTEGPTPRTLKAGIARLLDVTDMERIWAAAERVRDKALAGADKHTWPLKEDQVDR